MRTAPNLWALHDLIRSATTVSMSRDGKSWVPGRPHGLDTLSNRLRCAWMVFAGRADAVVWPEGQ